MGVHRKIDGLDIHEVKDGYVVYREDGDQVHFLNHTAVLILELCDGEKNVDDMMTILQDFFPEKAPTRQDVADSIARLVSEGLVVPC